MKKSLILFLLFITYISLSAQLRLDVDGDAKISGSLNLNAASQNVFIGQGAGSNTTGIGENVFIGFEAGEENTSGFANVFIGRKAGKFNETGKDNVFIGKSAGSINETGERNVFIGKSAGNNNKTGQDNTFIGTQAGNNNETGQDNTFIGMQAGNNNETGQDNTFIGKSAGHFMERSTRNTIIGKSAGASLDSLDRAIAIGYNAEAKCHNCAVIGGTVADAVKVGIGTDTPLSDLHIKQSTSSNPTRGIRLEYHSNSNFWTTYIDASNDYNFRYNGSLIAYIDDVTGNYVNNVSFTSQEGGSESRNSNTQKMETVLEKVKKLHPTTKTLTQSRNGQKAWGFIAEEVAKVFPEITPEKDGKKGIIYDYFGILSIKAIQELAARVEEQDTANESLKAENNAQNNAQNKDIENLQFQVSELKFLVEKLLSERAETPKSTSYLLPLEQNAQLSQNQPNPFNENTIVDYFVPATVKNAFMQVTAFDGKILGKVNITETGKGQVTIQSKSYPTGTYFYSLVLDGQMMETKRMVVAR